VSVLMCKSQLSTSAARGRVFRSLKDNTPKRAQRATDQPPITPPALTNENTWNGVFPNADANMEATSEYIQEGLKKLLSHDALVVTRFVSRKFGTSVFS
jgi:hypothetical protein